MADKKEAVVLKNVSGNTYKTALGVLKPGQVFECPAEHAEKLCKGKNRFVEYKVEKPTAPSKPSSKKPDEN